MADSYRHFIRATREILLAGESEFVVDCTCGSSFVSKSDPDMARTLWFNHKTIEVMKEARE